MKKGPVGTDDYFWFINLLDDGNDDGDDAASGQALFFFLLFSLTPPGSDDTVVVFIDVGEMAGSCLNPAMLMSHATGEVKGAASGCLTSAPRLNEYFLGASLYLILCGEYLWGRGQMGRSVNVIDHARRKRSGGKS